MGRRALVVLVVVAGVLLAACTGDADDEGQEPPLSEQLQESDPPEPVELSAERPASARDAASVSTALWATDPCALLPDDIDPTRIQRESPHVCSIDYEDRAVDVKVGAFFGEGERVDYKPITIAGRRAYEIGPDRNETLCYIWIPISPTASILIQDVEYFTDKVSCRLSKRIAAQAIGRIGAGKTGPPPAKGVEPSCQVLRAALADRLTGRRLVYGGHRTSIDSCAAVSAKAPKPDEVFEPPAYASLELSSERSDSASPNARVGGRDVRRRIFVWEPTNNRRCEMEWINQGDVVSVTTRSCPLSRDILEKVMDEYDRNLPKQTDSPPLRPYKPGESDRDAVGTCNDYFAAGLIPGDEIDASLLASAPGCRPYERVDLPPGAAEKLRDAHADPRVTCELARTGVSEHVAGVKPVVLTSVPTDISDTFGMRTRPCAFIDDQVNRQYLVVASADPLPPAIAHDRAGYVSEDEATDLRFVPEPEDDWDLAVAAQVLGKSKADPGYVAVLVNGDRGLHEPGVADFVTTADAETAEAILDSIVDEHFEEAS